MIFKIGQNFKIKGKNFMYDILIVGGGISGISAGIYCKRAGKKVAVVEKYVVGGQIDTIGKIENYPGFPSIQGRLLAENLFEQANQVGLEIIFDDVISFDFEQDEKKLICANQTLTCKAVILAMGCATRELNIQGEKEFFGKGVSYCAMCDGNFFKGKSVAVIGSGDGAVSNALYLSNICKDVHLFAKNNLNLFNYTEKDIQEKTNISLHKNVQVTKFEGNEKVKSLEFLDGEKIKNCEVEGVFVSIGRIPPTQNLEGKIELGDRGYIVCHDSVKTSMEGVFACGDVVEKSVKQIVTAGARGVIASLEAMSYVAKHKTKK